MEIRYTIAHALANALSALGISIEPEKIPLEHPGELAHGDYASGVALQCAKQAAMNPRELAEKVVAQFGTIEGVSKIDIAGPGFINFTLSGQALSTFVEEARGTDGWGSNVSLADKKIMVEYTDPNPFKEFHIGHLMSNAIGESIARLLQFSGANVLRANYQGDVGVHVAKAIYVLLQLKVTYPTLEAVASAYVEGSRLYEDDAEAKKEIDAINKKIYERSDPEVNALYDIGRHITLEHFEEIYKILGTKFDLYFFESETAVRGKKLVQMHPEIFELSEGATVFKAEQYGLHTRVFLNSQGLPTYEAKELGLAEAKKEKAPCDFFLTVTANEISEYFKVVRKAAELVDPTLAGRIQVRFHGFMKLATGKMSSRKGNVITGETLLQELAEAAKERAQESRAEEKELLAQEIAVAAIKYQILKQSSGKDIIFDRDRALSLEGDSGPYLQYSFARASAIVEKAKEQEISTMIYHSGKPNTIERLLYRFPEVVERAAREYEPHYVANFLIELASAFNSWYAQVHILDGSPEQSHKVALVEAVHRTLKNGLWILGIPAPEKM